MGWGEGAVVVRWVGGGGWGLGGRVRVGEVTVVRPTTCVPRAARTGWPRYRVRMMGCAAGAKPRS